MAGVIILKISVVDKKCEQEHVLFGFFFIPHAIHIDFSLIGPFCTFFFLVGGLSLVANNKN